MVDAEPKVHFTLLSRFDSVIFYDATESPRTGFESLL